MKKSTNKGHEKKAVNKILFTQNFGIKKEQEELEFVNIYVNADRRFFLDPAKLLKYNDNMSLKMSNQIVDFFDKLLEKIRINDRSASLEMLSNLNEPKEIHLGYAVDGYAGNAMGGIKSEKLFMKLSQSNAVKTGVLKDLEESALLVEGINRDVISDMTVMIIKEYLIKFTQEQCGKYGIPMTKVNAGSIWDNAQGKWILTEAELPLYDEKPIILVPKKIVTDTLTLNPQDFYRNEVLSFVQDELMQADRSLVVVLKNGKRRCAITKKQLRADRRYKCSKELLYTIIQKHPELLEKYRCRKKYTQEDIDEKLKK